MRLLVTGSRTWTHYRSVGAVLEYWTMASFQRGEHLTVVNGMADEGLDALAARWVKLQRQRGWPVETEEHPADWTGPCRDTCTPGHRKARRDGTLFCPAAGNYRNDEMVATRPDRAAAFHRAGSTGTADCIRRARKAGIIVDVHDWNDREGLG